MRGANYNKILIFVFVALVFAVIAIRLTFFYTPTCHSFECFQQNMKNCEEAIYFNDDVEATWRYEILGIENNECDIDVKLLQPKQGELGIDRLSGFEMTCSFPRGVATYPERFLDRCRGRLKEEFQAIVINKLHSYILENIGEIDESVELLEGF